MSRKKVWVAWSSGKDSAWALHVARQDPALEIAGLLTTVTETYARVTMHGVRESLVEAQAEAVGLPLHRVRIPTPCPNEEYDAACARVLEDAKTAGIGGVVFGDLFLADVREYREKQMARAEMEPLFPLWESDTAALAREMVASGVRAYITCLDPAKLPRSLAGAVYDESFLRALSSEIDPCGENGEFHTFAWDGPVFRHPVSVVRGEVVERDGFVFCDLLPDGVQSAAAERNQEEK